LHAAVEDCFHGERGVERRSIWRVDALRGSLYLLLLSREATDFTHMTEQFGELSRKGEILDYDAFLKRVDSGQTWRFRLRANPAHSEKTGDGNRGKVYAHVTTGQQRQWLLSRAEKNGFSITDGGFDVVESEQIKFRRDGKIVTLGTATFEGVLTILDEALSRAALINGIGRAKAYGCGLLTLARLG
jgi:CRISPR system Cascade subunit CasE